MSLNSNSIFRSVNSSLMYFRPFGFRPNNFGRHFFFTFLASCRIIVEVLRSNKSVVFNSLTIVERRDE
jgi:hypothetical protein